VRLVAASAGIAGGVASALSWMRAVVPTHPSNAGYAFLIAVRP